jgi:hypothetical protein
MVPGTNLGVDEMEKEIGEYDLQTIPVELMRKAKEKGYADRQIAPYSIVLKVKFMPGAKRWVSTAFIKWLIRARQSLKLKPPITIPPSILRMNHRNR